MRFDAQTFREMWERGCPQKEIAAAFGLNEEQVGRRRQLLGLQPRPLGKPGEPRAPSPAWPDERVERLKALDAEGLSCSQIAWRLNRERPDLPPLTRNAVIGKFARMQGGKTTAGIGPAGRPRTKANGSRPRARKPGLRPNYGRMAGGFIAAPPELAPEPYVPPATPVPQGAKPFIECKDGECRFVFGDPKRGPALACGMTTAASELKRKDLPMLAESYCRHHLGEVLDLTHPDTRAAARRAGVITKGNHHG